MRLLLLLDSGPSRFSMKKEDTLAVVVCWASVGSLCHLLCKKGSLLCRSMSVCSGAAIRGNGVSPVKEHSLNFSPLHLELLRGWGRLIYTNIMLPQRTAVGLPLPLGNPERHVIIPEVPGGVSEWGASLARGRSRGRLRYIPELPIEHKRMLFPPQSPRSY
ncbi:hypothetical protein XELAEV_18026810mg [Xenopus laevis]|uniref:Uncharacterized protein n=1 Tax=Xenopus laevis TaxID=8355 RepID=A0A974CWD0_XENLA|nr:hypothetical protein XELAEV_18026810mg [Xenopus laevis]